MAMLTHARGPFKPAPHSSGRRDTSGTGADAHLAMIKRFCVFVLMILMGGGAVAGVIALRTAAYFWRFHY